MQAKLNQHLITLPKAKGINLIFAEKWVTLTQSKKIKKLFKEYNISKYLDMNSPANNFFLIDYKFYTMKASLDSQ